MGLNVAVLGIGRAGINHLHAYSNSRKVSNVYICDQNLELIKEAGNTYSFEQYYTDLNNLLQEECLDGISICTPAEFHLEHSKVALESGVNVLLEKPMVSTTDEAKHLHSVANKSDSTLTVVHNEKFTPGMQSLYENLRKLNSISHIQHTRIKHHSGLIKNKEHWVHELKGGYWGEVMPHRIYTLYEMVGNMQIIDVQVAKLSDKFPWFKADHVYVILDSNTGPIYLHLGRKDEGHIREYDVFGKEKKITATYTHSEVQSYHGSVWEAQSPISTQLANTRQFIPTNKVYFSWLHHRIKEAASEYIPQIESTSWIEKTLNVSHREFIFEYIEFLLGNCDNPVGWDEAFHTLKLADEICGRIDEQTP